MESLNDNQIGADAKKEIKAFSEYTLDIFQAYTAFVLTFVSGGVQIVSRDGTGPLGIVLLCGTSVVVGALLYSKEYIGDPMLYQSFTRKWKLSPVSLSVIFLNFIIILSILI